MPTCTAGSLASAEGHIRQQCCCLCQASSTLRLMAGQISTEETLPQPLVLCCFFYFLQTSLCCLPLRGSHWQSALSPSPPRSVWLALFLHLPFHFTRASKWNKRLLMFFFTRKLITNKPSASDNKLAGWQINSSDWSLGVSSLKEKIRDTNAHRVSVV